MRPRALLLRAGLAALVGVAGCLTDPARFDTGSASSTGGADATTTSSSSTTSSTSSTSTDASSTTGTGGGSSVPVHYATAIGDGPDERINALVVHPSTSVVYIGGSWEGAFDWPTPPIEGCNGQATHAFVGRVETSGDLGWGDCLGNNASVFAMDFDDQSGTLTVVGAFTDTLQWDPTEPPYMSNAGSKDVFVAQWVDTGTTVKRGWFKQFGGPGDDVATGVAISGNGATIYVVGTFEQTMAVPDPLVSIGGADIFVLSLDSTGAVVVPAAFGDGGPAPEVHVSRHGGALWIGGAFNGEITFGSKLTSDGRDAFLVKLSDNLVPEKPEGYGLAGTEAIHGLAAGSDHLGVGGEYGSKLSFKPNGTDPLIPNGPQDAFAALVGVTNGTYAAQAAIAAPGEQKTLAVAARQTRMAFAGYFEGAPLFPGGTQLDAGSRDAFVQVWQGTTPGAPWPIGGATSNETATAVGASTTLTVIAGTHTAEFQVGGRTVKHLSGNGTTGAFVVALDE